MNDDRIVILELSLYQADLCDYQLLHCSILLSLTCLFHINCLHVDKSVSLYLFMMMHGPVCLLAQSLESEEQFLS